MAPKRVTRSSVRGGATPRGGRTGGRGGRGGRGAANDTSNPSNDGGRTGGRGGRGGGHGVENNDNNDGGNTDFEAIIARQLENFLPTIVTQVGDHMNNLANHESGINNTNGIGQNGNGNNIIRTGCTYKEFTSCKPIDFNGVGGALAYTRWVEKMETVIDISNCAAHQMVKYSMCLLSGKALTWWNTQIQARGRAAAVGMTWDDFKALLKEEYCPDNEMQKLEDELYHHSMIGAGHAAYTDRFHELARLVPHLVTPESKRIERYIYGLVPEIRGTVKTTEPSTIQSAILRAGTLTDEMVRNGSLRNSDKRKGTSESNKQMGTIADNKRARTFAATNSGQKEYLGPHPKCTKCNFHHQKIAPCRVCAFCRQSSHFTNQCRELANVGNMTNNQRTCYECNSPDHFRNNCPKLKRNLNQGGNRPNLAAAIEGPRDEANEIPPAIGRAYFLGNPITQHVRGSITGTFS
jgi:hypothetical protein